MPYTTIIYAKKEHIAQITLNRSEANNVINQQMAGELEEICRQINQDDDIYTAIITGAGDKVFCNGSEPEQLIQADDTDGNPSAKPNETGATYSVARAIAGIDQPVIAVINGDALGQGLELALSCDIRLASHRARFGFPQVAMGLMPTDGGTQRLPRIVGKSKALEMILSARTINAEEAFEIGLVHKIVGQEELAAEAETLAETLAGKGPIALKYIKEAVNKGLDLTLEQGLRLEADLYFLLHTTADRTEGIEAFLRKRPPRFKGQ